MKSVPPTRSRRRYCECSILSMLLAFVLGPGSMPSPAAAEEVLPKHVTPDTLKAVRAGSDYLAQSQNGDGCWQSDQGGQAYPVAMTGLAGTALLANGNSPTRGRYAPQVEKAIEYLVSCATSTGLITGPRQDSGQPMHGHGFALMFLASRLRHETKTVAARQDASR